MKHPIEIEGYDLAELAQKIGNLRYDALVVFLDVLSKDLHRQSDADRKRGRYKLANALYDASGDIWGAVSDLEVAWKICEPFMKDGEGVND